MKVIELKSNGQTLDYVLIDDGNKKILKSKSDYEAEKKFGRELLPSEVSLLNPLTKEVIVKQSGLRNPQRISEVKEINGKLGESFLVSDNGLLISKRTNKILRQNIVGDGYIGSCTKIGGRKGDNIMMRTHRIVAETFIENPENKEQVNHKNGIKSDAHINNLEWVSPSENIKHAYSNELLPSRKGFDSPNSILNKEQVDLIREKCKIQSRRKTAIELGVNRSTVDDIINEVRYCD